MARNGADGDPRVARVSPWNRTGFTLSPFSIEFEWFNGGMGRGKWNQATAALIAAGCQLNQRILGRFLEDDSVSSQYPSLKPNSNRTETAVNKYKYTIIIIIIIIIIIMIFGGWDCADVSKSK